MLSGIAILVFITPVGYTLLSSSYQWKNHSLSLTTIGTGNSLPFFFKLTYSLCHRLNTSKILKFVSVLILNKFNLYHLTNHCVLYWLILIPKRGSYDPNIKRGAFDQSKYVRSCDVTANLIVYYVPRCIMRFFYATSDNARRRSKPRRSRDEAETKPRRDQSCEHFKRVT